MVGTWAEFGLIAPIASEMRWLSGSVVNFDRSPNTDRSVFNSIDVNKRSRRCHTDLEIGL